ncbi:MAG: GH3 auxin-responsive promoter family protein [Candidatus Omnitrophica bacterium]|nr:GH3 auxin-responsive promoter family protein [Candidatus Omnitrophota bacterium]
MNIARLALKCLAFRAKAFEISTRDPLKFQKKVLLEYVYRNKNTEYGRLYNFSKVRSISDYQRLVPLAVCETLRPYISRMARGEQNILTVDHPIFFGATSGTTNKPKLIPVTKFSQKRKAALMGLWTYYITRDHPGITDGKVLAIISPEKEGVTESGLIFGAETGHAYKNLPFAIKHIYVLPKEVYDIEDFETRYYCILRIGLEEKNITTVATLNPSTLIILCQKIKAWQNDIIDDIGKGTLNRSLNVPAKTRKALEGRFRPNPDRAKELKSILEAKDELLPKYFWSNLELIECWKGGTVKLYLKELPQYFGDVPTRDMGCLSTETRSSIPTSDEGAGGVLAIKTNFYEFIPREDMDKPDKRVLLCDQLEKGREYLLVVTTPGGLYRYNIDDVIIVDGFFNKTPVIEFLQKGHNATSLAGEKLYESQVNAAINSVVEKYNLSLALFSTAVQWDMPPRYVFLIEFDDARPPVSGKELLISIDNELRNQNREYDYARQAQILNSPVLKILNKGSFEKYRAKKIRQGAHDSQFKAPELTADPEFVNNFDVALEVTMD